MLKEIQGIQLLAIALGGRLEHIVILLVSRLVRVIILVLDHIIDFSLSLLNRVSMELGYKFVACPVRKLHAIKVHNYRYKL